MVLLYHKTREKRHQYWRSAIFSYARLQPQTMPIHSGNQPLPLRLRQHNATFSGMLPNKPSPMQTPLAQPHTGTVPQQHFDAIARAIAKHKRRARTRRSLQRLLHQHRQTVDPPAHIYRINHQPDLPRIRNQRHFNNSPNQCGETVDGSSST